MLCKCLDVHHSVYYYHQNHQANSYKIANQKLDIEIKKIYDESKGRHVSPKITEVLNNDGINISQKRVDRRMNFLGLRSIVVKKFNYVGNSKSDNTKEYSNLLEQNFFADKPCQKWVGDIILKKQDGLNMTDELVIKAFKKALINRELNKDGIFHLNKGSQYTSNDYENLLEKM